MNRKLICYIIGCLMQIEALLFLIPALTALLYHENSILVFLGTTVFCLVLGQILKGKKPEKVTVYSSSGYISVALSWIAMSLAGAIPLYFSGYFSNPVDALFEIVSGFTTTGATILSDVEILPRSILIWRSLSHWVGGMGILVFMLAILPITGASGMNLMRAESPGPSVGKLFPKVRSTAKILYSIYFFLTLAEMIILIIVGCPIFDSVNLALATAGTGGFGVLNSSAGDYNTLVQITLTVFMILFGVNFNIYFLIYTKQFKDALKSEELRTYFGIIGTAIVLISANTYHIYSNVGETLKHSSFQVASIITTTGFSTTDFNMWPEFSRTVLVMLMFIGACAGSTGGGIKVSRIIIMTKTVRKEIAFIRHPRNVRKTRFEGKQVEHEVVRAINIFLISYLAIFVFSILLLSLNDYDGVTNFTAVASALNNIGPGLNLVGPMSNFGHFSNFSKLVLIMDMLAGRLEIFPILMLGNVFIKRKQWN